MGGGCELLDSQPHTTILIQGIDSMTSPGIELERSCQEEFGGPTPTALGKAEPVSRRDAATYRERTVLTVGWPAAPRMAQA